MRSVAMSSQLLPLDTQCCNTYSSFMSPSLKEDLRQRKAFTSLQQEAYLNVIRTSSKPLPVAFWKYSKLSKLP